MLIVCKSCTASNAATKHTNGSKADKQPGNVVGDTDGAQKKSSKCKIRVSAEPTQPILVGQEAPQPSTPNREDASTVKASVSLTHAPEDAVTCRTCHQDLPLTEFSKSKLKKLKKPRQRATAC